MPWKREMLLFLWKDKTVIILNIEKRESVENFQRAIDKC
jgi:hypothetical protein